MLVFDIDPIVIFLSCLFPLPHIVIIFLFDYILITFGHFNFASGLLH
jgi:hypothetical protein